MFKVLLMIRVICVKKEKRKKKKKSVAENSCNFPRTGELLYDNQLDCYLKASDSTLQGHIILQSVGKQLSTLALTESGPGVLQFLDLVLDKQHRHSKCQNSQKLDLGRHHGP